MHARERACCIVCERSRVHACVNHELEKEVGVSVSELGVLVFVDLFVPWDWSMSHTSNRILRTRMYLWRI